MKGTDRLKGKGLIRSLDRKGTGFDKSPPVARRGGTFRDPSICERCGAIYERKSWRRAGLITSDKLSGAAWVVCPACAEAKSGIAYGKVLVSGDFAREHLDQIRRRIANVDSRARANQPERRILSADWNGKTLEILTTSQKLAHRIARSLRSSSAVARSTIGRTKMAACSRHGSVRPASKP